MVEKDRLMKEVWPDAFVEEGNLTQNISVLRKLLSNGDEDHPYIQTVPRRGYRFVGSVREFGPDDLIIEEHSQMAITVEQRDQSDKLKLVEQPQSKLWSRRNIDVPPSSSRGEVDMT